MTLIIVPGTVGASIARQGAGGAVSVTGAFQSLGAQRLPRFSIQATFGSGPTTRNVGVISTADRLFVSVDGGTYLAPPSLLGELRRSYTQGAAATASGGVPALGIDPLRWLTHPARLGTVTLDGVRTVHIRTGLNTRRLNVDLTQLQVRAGVLGTLGLAPGSVAGSTGSSQVSGGRADVYVGAADHLLRRLWLRTSGPRPVSVVLTLVALNEPQTIQAPARARPLLRLFSALSRVRP